jgi:hypothetical protein
MRGRAVSGRAVRYLVDLKALLNIEQCSFAKFLRFTYERNAYLHRRRRIVGAIAARRRTASRSPPPRLAHLKTSARYR